jgi:nucleoside-diphosphate-sugar epimerase
MRFLVTGGAGFIGHNVVKFLEGLGHECFIVDTCTDYGFIPQDETNYLIGNRLKKIRSNIHYVDIRNREMLDNMFRNFLPHAVIHLASFPRQKVVSASPAWGSEVMITGLINLLESANKNRIKRFTYISSSMVYGDFENQVKEDFDCKPQGQYGIMKLAGEWLVKDYARKGAFDYTIIRPSAVYGEWDVEDRVVSKFMLAAMRGNVLKVNGANETLDFTHVDDTALGIVQATLNSNGKNKTYNITKSHSHSLLDAAKLAVAIAGKGSIECRDRDTDFPSRGALSIDAARRDFGFNPKIEVEEGFQRYYNWFKESEFWSRK